MRRGCLPDLLNFTAHEAGGIHLSPTALSPKISILMPVYNVADYLPRALESVLRQTLPEIELICVDDGSTDESGAILRRYAGQDPRIRLCFHETNRGLVAARKTAAQAACGRYIMILDGDDELLPTACETVWREEEKAPVDILQFGTEILFASPLPPQERENLQDRLRPCRHPSGDLVTACFREHRWSHTLWNKAYRTDLWKQILEHIEPAYINVSEDEYLFFLLSSVARTSRGIPDRLYRYAVGRGLTGHTSLPVSRYAQQCARATAYDCIETFLTRSGTLPRYASLLAEMRSQALSELVIQWLNLVPLSQGREAYGMLVDTWGLQPVMACLAELYWDQVDDILARLAPGSLAVQERPGKPVRTIAVYYYRLSNGGVERVISHLMPLWQSMGYRVVLLTEQPPAPEDYPVPQDVVRLQIPPADSSARQNYARRAAAWQEVVQAQGIDTIVYAAHVCSLLPWDLLVLKGLGCNCILHAHSTFSFLYYEGMPTRFTLTHSYRLADRVVTLSRIYNEYWGNFCPSFYIPNPVGRLCPPEDCSPCNGTEILWVGRLSPEKRFDDALQVLALVREQVPQATLTVVGSGETPQALAEARARAQELGLESCVRFEGFRKEVDPYYRRAAVFLFTSQYEGFPMVLVESKSHGLPTVMYDLKYLELVRDARGLVTVPLGDTSHMAQEVVRLLQQEDDRHRMAAQARQSAEDLAAFDLARAWQTVFDSLRAPAGAGYITPPGQQMMLNLLLDSAQAGSRTFSHTVFTEANAHRLVHSKFMKLAVLYWRLTDPVKANMQQIKKAFSCLIH